MVSYHTTASPLRKGNKEKRDEPEMTTEARTTRYMGDLTALDIVTIAMFAAVGRALWFPTNFLRFLAPFDLLYTTGVAGLNLAIVVTIIRKPGAATLTQIAHSLLGALIFGTSFWVWPVNVGRGIIADLIFWKTFYVTDPGRKAMLYLVIGTFIACTYDLSVWLGFIQKYAFGVVYPMWMYPTVIIGASLSAAILSMFGNRIGETLRALTI